MTADEPRAGNALAGTVLIVDDEPANLAVLSKILQPHYRVRAARSGDQALRIADSEPKPDLILLDIMMPEMDGYAVLTSLREKPATAQIPVIFVTALNADEDESRGLELGAVDYLTKPLRPSIVLARTAAHLELKAARDRLAKQNVVLEKEVQAGAQKLEQTQTQLLQSEKMASIGVLAAGVAHEINNPIGYVYSNLGTLRNYLTDLFALLDACAAVEPALPAGGTEVEALRAVRRRVDLAFLREDVTDLVAESREGIERVKRIVQDLKQFSHTGADEQWQRADLQRGLESTLNIVWNELKYKAEVVKQYGELPTVECLPSQLNQVFMNLLVNAAQAIEERGVITLRTGRDGQRVWVEIADTGGGIAPGDLTKIFDPFFTTKPVGKGTGLGLALTYAIVNKHHGDIEVTSTLGGGTSFKVSLPIDQPQAG